MFRWQNCLLRNWPKENLLEAKMLMPIRTFNPWPIDPHPLLFLCLVYGEHDVPFTYFKLFLERSLCELFIGRLRGQSAQTRTKNLQMSYRSAIFLICSRCLPFALKHLNPSLTLLCNSPKSYRFRCQGEGRSRLSWFGRRPRELVSTWRKRVWRFYVVLEFVGAKSREREWEREGLKHTSSVN